MMVLVWLPRKKVMFFIEAGSPGGEVKSKRVCQANIPGATGFDYSFSNDAARFIAP